MPVCDVGCSGGSAREQLETMPFFFNGILGVYNYGCEAIIRGTQRILEQHYPTVPLVYVSPRPDEDGRVLKDLPVQVVDRRYREGRLHPRRMANRVFRRLGLACRWRSRKVMYWGLPQRAHWYQPGDVLLSIGGDMFTLPTRPYPARVNEDALGCEFAREIRRRGVRYVLWGASVGPFEDWPDCVPIFQRFLQGIDLITAREAVTVTYLEQLGVRDTVVSVADPAFLMEVDDREEDFPFAPGSEPVLGVNLSPLSAMYAYNADCRGFDEVIAQQAVLLARLIEDLAVRVLLIPHVIAPHDPEDDDLAYLQAVRERLESRCPGRAAVLSSTLGARRTKAMIKRCAMLLAARMHCAIGGVSVGVPTLFLSYSAKARGMASYIYGSEEWCMGLSDLTTPHGYEKALNLWRQREVVAQHLQARQSKFREDALSAGKALARVMPRSPA